MLLIVAGIVLLAGVALAAFFVLRRRKSDATVFEQVEKTHEEDASGALMKQREAGFLNIVYGLAAAMVVADGRIEKAEIDRAEELGARLIPNFSNDDFVTVVKGHAKLPHFTDMVDAVAPLLPMEAKAEIFDYLQAIATADGQISPDEKHYIHHVTMAFGLDKQ